MITKIKLNYCAEADLEEEASSLSLSPGDGELKDKEAAFWLRRVMMLVIYTVNIGNIIMPTAASSTESTRPIGVTAIMLEPTVVASMKAHQRASS